MTNQTPYLCPMTQTLSIIGGKWKILIIHHLLSGTKRFSALRRDIPDISQRMLTLQLRELEADGLVQRKVYAEVPPRVEYSLTVLGDSLMPVIQAMHDWGVQHAEACTKSSSTGEKS